MYRSAHAGAFGASSLVLLSVLVCATRTVMLTSRRLANALSCGFLGSAVVVSLGAGVSQYRCDTLGRALILAARHAARSVAGGAKVELGRTSGCVLPAEPYVPRGHLGDVLAKPLEQRSDHAGTDVASECQGDSRRGAAGVAVLSRLVLVARE